MTEIFFYFFSLLAIATAIMVIASPQPIHSVLYLVVTMFSLASLFALLGAHFLAIIQILIYAGAILVLFLFVIMMLDLDKEGTFMRQTLGLQILGAVTAVAFVGEMLFIFSEIGGHDPSEIPGTRSPFQNRNGVMSPNFGSCPPISSPGSIQAIGRVLFSEHLLAFELTSFLMLAAILGAVVLSKKTWKR